MTDLRLNLGCGMKRLAGYVNVDKFGDPDLCFDLETFPYPWNDNSVIEIEIHHVLEHLGQQTQTYLKIIQELYRICQPRARLHITVPHHRSDRFFHDPTHVRPITAVGLSMFSKQRNREWQEAGKAFTLLALYLNVDFELMEVIYTPSEVWLERYPESASDTKRLLKESEIYSNLIKDVEMTLIAVKSM
jgi:CRISPR/Cas system-associated endonuclease/helicase Cas3